MEQLTTKILKQNSNRRKRVELWAKNMKNFREFRTPFPPRDVDIRKNPRSMYERVPQAMAQFVLKIELLSHIMGNGARLRSPSPIMAPGLTDLGYI